MMQGLVAGVLLLCGCCIGVAAHAAADGDPAMQPLVTIDGFDITALHLALFAGQTGRNPEQAEDQLRMLNELANNFMLANSEQGRALEKSPEIRAALDVARARLVAQAFVRNELENAAVDEAMLRERYTARYGGGPGEELKASHILLNSRDAAEAAVRALDDGQDFAELASQHSIGPSKSVGGDLGWFAPDQMVPEFAAATRQLDDGEYTREPVKTQFGWHVIRREDSRETEVPTFESVRADLESELRQEKVSQLVKQIREAADIEVQRLDGDD